MYPEPPQPDQPPAGPGSGWPATGPVNAQPMSPGGWPAAAPTSTVPASPVGSGSPARRGLPPRVFVAAAIVAVLLLGLAGNEVAVLVSRSHLRAQMSTLDSELAARQQAQKRARDDLRARFQQADLPGKLRKVRDLTDASSAALDAWVRAGEPLSGLKDIRATQNRCEDAVIDYDATAAQFTPDLLTGLPLRIDMTDDATNCRR